MSDRRRESSEGQAQGKEGRSPAEWTTLAISIGIIAGFLGVVTWLYFRGSEEPPLITVEVQMESLREEDGAWYLPIEVRNDGDRTVENTQVEGTLRTGEGEPQEASITVAFLAGGERVEGTLVFSDDPRNGELEVGPTSYQIP
ncbi:MAG TPA: hypothetical protein VGR22_09970 [Thermomicrobiales bacterium]|nr:hypothetical protein [Thermomicrobiales bacterium]